MPSRLAKLVESRTENRYPADGDAYSVEALWRMPETISQDLIEEARQAIPAAEAACQPAPKEALSKWLNSLGVLCAGRMSAEDAAVKLQAYSAMLEVPASILNKHTLDEAARQFQWFPSYSEIAQFLDPRAAAKTKILDRVRRIAAASPTRSEARTTWANLPQDRKDRVNEALKRAGISEPMP